MPEFLNALRNAFGQQIGAQVPGLMKAALILIIGWIAAKVIAAMFEALLRKTTIDNKIATFITGKEDTEVDVEKTVGTFVYYLIVVFVLVAIFEVLGLQMIAGPLNGLLSQVINYVPKVLAASVLLFAAWVAGSMLRLVVVKGLDATGIDQKLKLTEEEGDIPFAKSVGETIYWICFLFVLPGVLSALQMQGLLSPVQTMLNQVMAFVPHLFGGAVILGLGWFAARVISKVVTNVLSAGGVDKFSETVGLSTALGKAKLSKTVGLIVYVLVLLPAIVGALDALQMRAVTEPVNQLLHTILGAVPGIFSAIIIMALFHVLGQFVGNLVAQLTAGMGFDRIPALIGLGPAAEKKAEEGEKTEESGPSATSPSYLLGKLVYITVMIIAVIEASDTIGFEYISNLVQEFAGFAVSIISGVIIVGIGLYLGTLAARAITASGATAAPFLGTLARIAIIFLAGAMGLRRMGLANEIIELAFGLLVGAVAVAVAVAFGLGSKEIAGREVENWLKGVRGK